MDSKASPLKESVEEQANIAQNNSSLPDRFPPPKAPEHVLPIPGTEILGRGIYLKPRMPYELKHRFIEFKPEEDGHIVYCVDASQSYLVSDNFEVNHSPPMPANQMLNQTVIEQSWESLESHFEVDANVAAGIDTFSVKSNYSHIKQLRSSEEAYYALRASFIPAWTVDFIGQPDVEGLRLSLRALEEAFARVIFIDQSERFKITEQTLESLNQEGVLKEIIDRLNNIKDLEYDQQGTFIAALQQQLGYYINYPYLYSILRYSSESGEKVVWQYDLMRLLSKVNEELTDADRTEIRNLVIQHIPEQAETLSSRLTEGELNHLREEWVNGAAFSKMDMHRERFASQYDNLRRELYEAIFQQYGTHFVKRVWVGGAATLAFAITKLEGIDIRAIQAGINASYGGLTAEGSDQQRETLETLKQTSTCSVWGKGGDEAVLAGINSLDQETYNRWLNSVRENPQVIELEVVGIWSLLCKENSATLTDQATHLREAYREIYEFEPITALFSPYSKAVYFIKSTAPQKVENYDTFEKRRYLLWEKLEDGWKGLASIGFDRVDAAFCGTSLPAISQKETFEDYDLKLYSNRDAYTEDLNRDPKKSVIIINIDDCLHFRITDANAKLVVVESESTLNRYQEDPAKLEDPKRLVELRKKYSERLEALKATLTDYWENGDQPLPPETKEKIIQETRVIFNHRFDLNWKVCFFRRHLYIWVDCFDGSIPPDVDPTPIKEGWPGVTFDRVDAALNVDPESIYLFCGDQYIRFNWAKNKVDEGYPKKIRTHWAGVTFDRIDAAIYWGNGKVYFFRGDRYIVYDMVTYRADPGYPKYLPGSYIKDWKIFD